MNRSILYPQPKPTKKKKCDFKLPLEVVVKTPDNGTSLIKENVKSIFKNVFKWENLIEKHPHLVQLTITSCDYKLIDLKKQLLEQGIAIFPLGNDKTTILLKTEPISSHDLWEKITDDKKGYPHIAFLHSIDNNEESSEAWEVTVKPGEIQKFINAEHDDSIQIVIPYSVSATRFDVCTVPPSVIVEEAGFFITAALRENATITNFSDGKLRILFSNYKSFKNAFKNDDTITALGVPFDVFFSKNYDKIYRNIGFRSNKYIIDDIFYTAQSCEPLKSSKTSSYPVFNPPSDNIPERIRTAKVSCYVIISGKNDNDLREDKLKAQIGKQFEWNDYSRIDDESVFVNVTSKIELKALTKIEINGSKIIPVKNYNTTVLIKTEKMKFSEVFNEITKKGANNPSIAFLENVNHTSEKDELQQAWNVFVKDENSITKLREMEINQNFVKIRIPYSEAKARFDISQTPPSVIISSKTKIDDSLIKQAKKTKWSNKEDRIAFDDYKDLNDLFCLHRYDVNAVGVPFNIFYSTKNMEKIRNIFKPIEIVEDNHFYD